ncbi:MAG: M20 family metallo-hydrolase [Thermoplasmata archaeon]
MKEIEDYREEMIEFMTSMIPIKAISPDLGGNGEWERSRFIKNYIENMGFDYIKELNAIDDKNYTRPNIIAKYYGKIRERTIWIAAHMDTVPEGDINQWHYDPFKATVVNDRIYGRGTEDNGQDLVAGLFAIKAIIDNGIRPKYNIGFMSLSDEEVGSKYGMEYVMENYKEFGKDDYFIIPDAGNEKGDEIEIAEKGILWLGIKVIGKQSHGSRPDLGKNSSRYLFEISMEIDKELHKNFDIYDNVFIPPYSTFEPTMMSSAVQNINTIPGSAKVYFDMRILPEYKIDDVLNTIIKIVESYKNKYGIEITLETVQRNDPAPKTPESSPLVVHLKKSINDVLKVEPKLIGIGGGTVAAMARKKGYHAVVWATLEPVEHSPDEYCVIKNMVNDAKVFYKLIKDF